MNFITGDLIELAKAGEFDVIVHGCNCFNTMGSGLAKKIHEAFPEAYLVDQRSARGDYNKLGNYTSAFVDDPYSLQVVNAYTQFLYNRGGVVIDRFEYLAFDLILQKLAFRFPHQKFGFPMIGCGLAEGDEKRIVASLQNFSEAIQGTVTIVKMP